jgi:hypothetical protein
MHSKSLSPWIFNLDGNFLGISADTSNHERYIVLEVDGEAISIKYPKQLCDRLKKQLKTGDRIQCIGRSQLDFLSKVVKLEAYQVWSAAQPTYLEQPARSVYPTCLAS